MIPKHWAYFSEVPSRPNKHRQHCFRNLKKKKKKLDFIYMGIILYVSSKRIHAIRNNPFVRDQMWTSWRGGELVVGGSQRDGERAVIRDAANLSLPDSFCFGDKQQ